MHKEMRKMNDFYAKAGQRIRNLREVNRYTREKLAELAEISPKFLYEIEVGAKGFSADTLSRIASAPVSYTHLDVYKRQILLLACL